MIRDKKKERNSVLHVDNVGEGNVTLEIKKNLVKKMVYIRAENERKEKRPQSQKNRYSRVL